MQNVNRFGQWVFEEVPLDALNLSWPKLAASQAEVRHLISEHAEAAREATALEAGREGAREQDLDAAAAAIRAGSGAPPPKALPALERKIEGAIRTREGVSRAVSNAIEDLEVFKRKHASELESDAARSLGVLRSKLAEKAKHTAALYREAESAATSVNKLSPPAGPPEETGPPGSGQAARSTVFAAQFVATTSQRSAGPDRGTIERVLSHLSSGLS
jgi:hypothetical protein